MKTLTHICVETEEAFKETYSGMIIGKLEAVASEWCQGLEIVSHKIIGGDKLIIVAEDKEDKVFYLYRLFPGGKENWNISVDLNGVSQQDLTNHLLKKYL